MKTRTTISVIVLAVALLAFGTIGTLPVPFAASTTETQQSLYVVPSVVPYTMATTWGYPWMTTNQVCLTMPYITPGCAYLGGEFTFSQYYTSSGIGYNTYQVEYTTTFPVTLTFTSVGPAFQALGMNGTSFGVGGIVVILLLVLVTIWVARTKPSLKESKAS